jgi:glucose-1-phosphate cytidylyltransferase
MKTVILAGGLGTRLDGDNPDRIPKPLTHIGGIPIIEHIMNIYSKYGYNEFAICLGYKGELIKKYFADYYLNHSNITIDLRLDLNSRYQCAKLDNLIKKPWIIDLIETGLNTATGSRLKKIKPYLYNAPFFMTYGDGLANVDLDKLLVFHKSHNKLVTMSTVKARGTFGVIELDNNNEVITFQEKPQEDNAYINIGYFVIEPEVLDWIGEGDNIWFEADVLPSLVKQGEVMAYRHEGEFKCLDSPKDKKELEEMWNSGNAFWR